ncbi:hypothetical protein OF83DRAFT_423146 [Amylostereum chailletii]|nr:hypothetical protein OF83DRAFT_423146 [Amylostereum chailletii]
METHRKQGWHRISLHIPITVMAIVVLSPLLQPVLAQAPVNDVVSWPSGLLLLASVLYAALGTAPEMLWDIEPAIGIFLFRGLPKVSIPVMQKVSWVANACHFVSGIRNAYGKSNFWIRADLVTIHARKEALEKALQIITFVEPLLPERPLDPNQWTVSSAGLMHPAVLIPISPSVKSPHRPPSARDFLLFAAIDYHVFREWEVRVYSKGQLVLNTKDMPPSSIMDVDDEEEARLIVAANMVRRPHSQTRLRALAQNLSQGSATADSLGPWTFDIDAISLDEPICNIDFHSYAPEHAKVSASLRELSCAYLHVVQYIKRNAPSWLAPAPGTMPIARIHVGKTLWIAILGGALLDRGRVTIQNLPGRWAMRNVSPDDAWVTRVEDVLRIIEPRVNQSNFGDLVFSGGISRRSAIPFLVAGIFGQIVVCYFLSVGTSAGVWTSVALANSLYAGRLNDLHSIWYGKAVGTDEPGMKMYVPGSKQLMAVATLDRSPPRQGTLRPGVLLNLFGLAAAIVGAVFTSQTRSALQFGDFSPTPGWVVYTSVGMAFGTTLLIAATIATQQSAERTWSHDSELPTRWMMYSTLSASVIVCGLAMFFQSCQGARFWPILDAVTWVSGLPLGMVENGRMFSADANMVHLVLLNRWMMGAVASALGSSTNGAIGSCSVF